MHIPLPFIRWTYWYCQTDMCNDNEGRLHSPEIFQGPTGLFPGAPQGSIHGLQVPFPGAQSPFPGRMGPHQKPPGLTPVVINHVMPRHNIWSEPRGFLPFPGPQGPFPGPQGPFP